MHHFYLSRVFSMLTNGLGQVPVLLQGNIMWLPKWDFSKWDSHADPYQTCQRYWWQNNYERQNQILN